MKLSTILRLAVNDCKSKFAGSLLGAVWLFIGPMLTIGIYCFVYTVALGGTSEGVPYSVWLICGAVPWFFFCDGINGSANVFFDYEFLVKKTYFHAEFLPHIRCISAELVHVIFIVLAYICLICYGFSPNVGQLWLLYWMAGGFLLTLGLGRILAVLCSFIRDLRYATGYLLQIGFWITPIFWSMDNLPAKLQRIYDFNPVSILIDGYRRGLIYGENLSVENQMYFWIITIILNILGIFMMKHSRPTLADRI